MPRLTIEAQRAQECAMRLKIREALLEMLARATLEEITIAQIAEHVGISSVTLYKYYPSRAALILDTFDYTREQLFDTLSVILQAPGTPYERLNKAVLVMFEECANRVNLFLATCKYFRFNDEMFKRRKERVDRVIAIFSAPLREAIAAGSARQVCPESTALILFESIIGVQRDTHMRNERLNAELATAAIRETIIDGLFIPSSHS